MISRIVFLLIVGLLVLLSVFGCEKKGPVEPVVIDTTSVPPIVRKPNIYLYPETPQMISVKLVFPLGGKVIESDPDFGSGWLVNVEPSGRIDGKYDYLFYEAQVPDRYQYSSGWIVRTDTLSGFFINTLANVGFTSREITDFIDYWLPILSPYPLLEVYPQLAPDLDGLIRLQVNPVPQSQLRLFFVIRPKGIGSLDLTTPDIPRANRTGYHLAEWGVIFE